MVVQIVFGNESRNGQNQKENWWNRKSTVFLGFRPLLNFVSGNMSAQCYIQEIIGNPSIPYLRTLTNSILRQDNASPHAAWLTIMNRSMENVRHIIGGISWNYNSLFTVAALHHKLKVVWYGIKQQDIDHPIRSISNSINVCVIHLSLWAHY